MDKTVGSDTHRHLNRLGQTVVGMILGLIIMFGATIGYLKHVETKQIMNKEQYDLDQNRIKDHGEIHKDGINVEESKQVKIVYKDPTPAKAADEDNSVTVSSKDLPANKSLDSNTDSRSRFLQSIAKPAVAVANHYGILPSVLMAQCALESAWGESTLATQGHNYFGIKGQYKGQSVIMPTAEYNQAGQKYMINAEFRKYSNIAESMEDNAKLLKYGNSISTSYYAGTWRSNNHGDYHGSTQALAKYATGPSYTTSLNGLIETYGLDVYDK